MKRALLFNFLLSFLFVPASVSVVSAQKPADEKITADFTNRLNAEDLRFTENKGQVADVKGKLRPDILFTAGSGGAKLFLTANGISYQFSRQFLKQELNKKENQLPAKFQHRDVDSTQFCRLDVKLIGANLHPDLAKENEGTGVENFYLAHCPNGILGVKNYNRIIYKNVYPYIDWVVYSKGGTLEYDFVVNPGGTVSDIKLQYEGATKIGLDDKGAATIDTKLGSVSEHKPTSFTSDGKKVESKFALSGNVLGFAVQDWDKSKVLTIDPEIVWATYYGGNNVEIGYSCKADNAGNVYMAGVTGSANGIASGGFQNTYGGNINDAFLAKFTASGDRLWATYYGGNDQDEGLSCTTDASGDVYITGLTWSANGISFNGFQNNYGGGSGDAFLVKFDSAGSRLWATYYGGSNEDDGFSCMTDRSGNIYLTGTTKSTDNIASAGFQNTYGGGDYDAFLVKFNSAGSRVWATYYGGESLDISSSCSVDTLGFVYIAGITSSATDIASGGFQNATGGNEDAFLVQFDTSGSRLWATYYGGTDNDEGHGCAIDNSGNIYLTGSTTSASGIAEKGFQNTYGGGNVSDAFLVKFSSSGARQWATYYGGADNDNGLFCATDNAGNVYITGNTSSSNDIASNGFQDVYGGSYDAFVAEFTATGERRWASYYGGSGDDGASSCTIDESGNLYLTGHTGSTAGIAFNGFQNTYGGSELDAFLAKISDNEILPLHLLSFTASLQNKAVNLTWQTVQETNTSYFVVERSKDGNYYSSLQQTTATGSIAAHTYAEIDNNPLPGKSLYRLKMVDKDGTFTYSNAVSINYIIKNTIAVSPNPAKDKLTVQLQSIGNATASLQITDINGKVIYTKQLTAITGENTLTIPVAAFAKGAYFLTIVQGKNKQTLKFIKE